MGEKSGTIKILTTDSAMSLKAGKSMCKIFLNLLPSIKFSGELLSLSGQVKSFRMFIKKRQENERTAVKGRLVVLLYHFVFT